VRRLFDPGRLVATPGALNVLVGDSGLAHALLTRHLSGDWGEVEEADVAVNDSAVQDGGRILSIYLIDGRRLFVLTEADRSCTTFVLDEEY
jgi:hypothetical protein